MTALILWYAHDQDGGHLAATAEEIDAALDHVAGLADNHGVVATITRSGDDVTTLHAGINGDAGALHYTDAEAAHYSRGDASGDGEVLSYAVQQDELELPPDAEIPVADVRAAVHEYARTGSRPTGIRWQRWKAPRTPGPTMPDPLDPAIWG
ncbi:Imm1 family immunity protein [Actinokineospora sp. 24-640]